MLHQRYVLVVDDEPNMRRVLEIMLRNAGHVVYGAANGREALVQLAAHPVDLVLTDMRMPELDGMGLLRALREEGNQVPVIVITAHGTVQSAVEAMRYGASDYILRPFDLEALELAIERTLGEAALQRQNRFMREEINRGWDEFVGTSAPMREVYGLIQQVAPTKASVMIAGETGTGKELAARAIHNASPRRDKLFVPINCAAIPADMLEAELFGYDKGAFTGALKDRIGKFELANEGTVFLDELTEMPMALQTKLLRFLQDNMIERLGSNRRQELDLRIIAATNRRPLDAVRQGTLREDLYYRLNVFPVALPPLRQRKEDIAALARHFARKFGYRGAHEELLEEAVLQALHDYDWPGNVRELQNVMERALVLSGGAAPRASHFSLQASPPAAGSISAAPEVGPLGPAVEQFEARLIEQALREAGGSKPRAAAALDISERTLWYKLKKLWPRDNP
ncbi:sigma-54-dependent transcriptional regulator [Duganella qianjiadongensis]|uniref:Response regulator n=1 Tax=Duganella qianjiadongensis TaxID=2692176 RepID=A0ABW9VJJ4_9BURK|nr:sigma-54 dependent transcriptional regulator [Duganella qianjiadongensis]MYM39754.1 response regulator [Duganella qianjiadongensis]